ncbi:TniQ family protein [Streptomyces sp. NPDC020799]|uniref:TniQ family protein n=1 Tax=Streptomyces sp. NPDC020799 TaxID=3365091 RepID=UPI00378A37DC
MSAAESLMGPPDTPAPVTGPVPEAAVDDGSLVLPGARRRLALAVPPEPGEAFPSWLDRLSADHGVGPGVIAQAIGVPARANAGSVFRPVLYSIVPTPHLLDNVAQATGVAGEQITALHLSRFAGTALDLDGLQAGREQSVHAVARREWALLFASRACPHCLRENGGVWPLWWRLGAAAACPRHHVLLVDLCPRCGIRLRQGYRGRPRGLSKVHPASPVICGNHPGGSRCPQDLRQIATDPVPVSLAAWQQRVLDAAEGARFPLAGERVEGRAWFTALAGLAALVRFAAPACPLTDSLPVPEDARRELAEAQEADRRSAGGSPAALRIMPASSALAAAVLAAVAPVMTAGSVEEAEAAVRPWAEAAVRRRRELNHNPLRHLDLPSALARVVAAAAPATSRVAGAARLAVAPAGFRPEHIPHLIDGGDYADLIAAHLPGTAEASGRRLGPGHGTARRVTQLGRGSPSSGHGRPPGRPRQ